MKLLSAVRRGRNKIDLAYSVHTLRGRQCVIGPDGRRVISFVGRGAISKAVAFAIAASLGFAAGLAKRKR